MLKWGVGFGCAPSDDGQQLISRTITAEGTYSQTRLVRDKTGQVFTILEAPGTRNPQSLTVKSITKLQLFRRELVQGADPNPPVLPLEERQMWLRPLNQDSQAIVRAWMSKARLYRDASPNEIVFARKLLAAMEAMLSFKWDPAAPKGVGPCLARGWGSCGDLNSIAVSVLKAAGIPARLRQGRKVIGAQRLLKDGEDETYHVAAEFWADKVGWVPIEASTFSGPDLRTGGRLTTFLGLAEPAHFSKHYDIAWLDGTARSFQNCDWVFGSWRGTWDGWSMKTQYGFKTIAAPPKTVDGSLLNGN